jgi:hypothetical protein
MKKSSIVKLLATTAFCVAPFAAQATTWSATLDIADQRIAANWDDDANQATDAVACTVPGQNDCNISLQHLPNLTSVGFNPGSDTIVDWSVTITLNDDEDSSSGPELAGAWTNFTSGAFQANERVRISLAGQSFGEPGGALNGAEDFSDTGRTEFTITSADDFSAIAGADAAAALADIQLDGIIQVVVSGFAGDYDITAITLTASDGVGGPVSGCTYGAGSNFDPSATEDDGSCVFGKEVPAMGLFGLVSLFGGLLSIGAVLNRRRAS